MSSDGVPDLRRLGGQIQSRSDRKWAARITTHGSRMASNQSDVQRYRSPPPSPSPPASLSLSDRSGHSTSSACRVCWRPSCQLGTHRDYAKRAALPPARTIAVARQPSKEHVSNFPIEMKANMRQLYNHCKFVIWRVMPPTHVPLPG